MEKVTQIQAEEIIFQEDISDIHFFGVNFSNQDFSKKDFTHCVFEKCNLSNVKLEDTIFNDITFRKTKLMGLSFVENISKLSPFVFCECNITLCSFHNISLVGSSFETSEMCDCDFIDVQLEKVAFSYCNFMKTSFVHCDFTKTDFTGSYNFVIDPSINKLKKTKFGRENCLGLLQHLDIEID